MFTTIMSDGADTRSIEASRSIREVPAEPDDSAYCLFEAVVLDWCFVAAAAGLVL
jgi:hypothetical protein